MGIIESLVFGLAQGLTEFIPVSSSGHVVLLQNLTGTGQDHLFLEFINLGTLAALIVYFRKRIVEIIRDVVVNKKFVLARNILITSVPAGIVGLLLSDFIASNELFGSSMTVALTLATVGFIMIILERLPKLSPAKDGEALSWVRALMVGLIQMFALIPGVSRSGSTIIAGRLTGLSPAAAAEYSFLASLPIMFAVAVKNFLKPSDREYFIANFPELMVGNIIAFIAGILAIGFLMNYLQKHGLKAFGWYRLLLAGVIVVILLLQLN